MDSTERFLRRKRVQKERESRHGLAVVVDNALVDEFLHSEVDWDSVQRTEIELNDKYDFKFNVEVSEKEVQEHLKMLKDEFNGERFRQLLTSCRDDVLSAVVGPFGLGGLVAQGDKNGGNVDTIHNARDGVYATDGERQRYEDRGDYISGDYHGHKDYINKNREDSESQDKGTLKDSYTGKKIDQNSNRHLDHTISAKEVHDDAGRVLAQVDGPDAANAGSNLNSTSEHINNKSGKGALTTDEFLAKLERTAPAREARIEELSAKEELTTKESRELERLREHEAVDADRMRQIDEKTRKEYNARINKKYYTSKKFLTNTVKTGVSEGAKMGTQQALGLVFCEFFKATFDEIQDIYAHGFSTGFDDSRFLHVLKERLSRIGRRIAAKWKAACAAFRDGFISGFLSNLVTVVINMFVRTGKRIVRVIREGFFSLLKAIKMLCFPPKGMTPAQAAHEASKLIATGLAVVGGIAVEQYIDGMIKTTPVLEPFADIITTVLIGGLTGLATTFIVYAIDKIDIFKVNAHEEHDFVMNKLETSLDRMFEEGDALVRGLAYTS